MRSMGQTLIKALAAKGNPALAKVIQDQQRRIENLEEAVRGLARSRDAEYVLSLIERADAPELRGSVNRAER